MSHHFGAAPSREDRQRFFEQAIWPHLAAAYHFARWLVPNHHDAEDVVQESFVKAFKSAETFRGSDARPWLFAIIRNSAMNFLNRNRQGKDTSLDDATEPVDASPNPEATLQEEQRRREVRRAIARLPEEFREALLLREMEGMAYKEIAYVLKIPVGTVMSRLARARALLIEELLGGKEAEHELR